MDHTFVIGRMVHYALDTNSQYPGQCRPAVITHIWTKGAEQSAIQLTVFADGNNDFPGSADGQARWVTSVLRDKIGHDAEDMDKAACTPRTWHWPDECPRAD